MRERMRLLIANRRQRRDDHVEAVKPRPALDVVKPRRSHGDHKKQSTRKKTKVAKSPHNCLTGLRFGLLYKQGEYSAWGGGTEGKLFAECEIATILGNTMANPFTLSVVMPVYNERATLRTMVGKVLAMPMDIELLCVDDGSRDGSRDILEELAAQH